MEKIIKEAYVKFNSYSNFSIVILVYNEAENIGKTIRDLYEVVIKKIPNSKLIVTEDGSTDGTKEILIELKKQIPFILISSDKRKGYTKAFKDALGLAKSPLIFFSDSDGQHDPGDILKLLKEINDNDILGGYKSPRHDRLHRIIISKVYNFIIGILFGLWMKDIDSGFKLIRKEVVDTILPKIDTMEYCVMSEFVLKAYLEGFKIKEIPVVHFPRKSGVSNIFHPSILPSIIIKLLKDLLIIRCNYKGNSA